MKHFTAVAICLLVSLLPAAEVRGADEDKLWVARPLTKPGEFTAGIEGPACDAAGNVFAVNFQKQQTIGRVTPEGRGDIFVTLPGKSTGNGIVFDREGQMYVADYVGHNVLRIDPKAKKITVFAHEAGMSQPNDLAIAPDGTLSAMDASAAWPPAWAPPTASKSAPTAKPSTSTRACSATSGPSPSARTASSAIRSC
jgi:streptogramin lyase